MSNILKLSLLLIFAFLFTQCFGEINDREGCDGYPELINTISDITVSISQESLFIDLSGSEDSVFKHTTGKTMSMNFMIEGRMSARVLYKDGNPELGWEAIIMLEETGTFGSTVFATDDCDKLARDNFELTITD